MYGFTHIIEFGSRESGSVGKRYKFNLAQKWWLEMIYSAHIDLAWLQKKNKMKKYNSTKICCAGDDKFIIYH